MSILRLSKALAILAAIVAVSLTISGQQQVAPNAQTGMNGSFLGPKSVEMAAVPQYTGGSLNPPSTRSAVPEQIYKARKAAAALAPRRPGGAVGGPPAAANSGAFEPDPMDAAGDALDTEVGVMTVGVSTSLEGMNLSQCGSLAPGGALAVGGNYLVQALNNCIVVMNNGTGAIAAGFPKSLNAFFGAGGSGVYGPRALYDAIRNRFVVVAAQYTAATGFGNLWIAISKTSDPTGAWWIYALGVDTAQSGDFPDFPTLGLDKDIMYVGVTLLKSVGSALTDVVKFLP
jgi:hypothetical protein